MPKHSILIVEDNAITALDIKDQLELLGYEVSGIALSGESALEMVDEHHPDLILMDIKLKEMDGIETAEKIKKKLNVPIIFITAYPEDNIEKKAEMIGDGYLKKPLDENRLKKALEIAFLLHKS